MKRGGDQLLFDTAFRPKAYESGCGNEAKEDPKSDRRRGIDRSEQASHDLVAIVVAQRDRDSELHREINADQTA